MHELALWYRKRLRALARGPRAYGRFDTVNPPLERWGLIVRTPRDFGPNRREYALTAAGMHALRDAWAEGATDAPDDPAPTPTLRRADTVFEART